MSSKSEGSRLLSVVLTATGVAGLIASVYISARVGWSLADNEADKIVTAGILGLADFAAAMIIIAASRMRVWGWYSRSYLAIAIAAVFLVAGYVTAYGFFSTRIAVHASQKAAAAVDKDYLKWIQGQTVNMELPRSQRLAMMKEAREGRDTLKSTMRVVSDKYAAAIGAWLGWTIEETQTRLTAATAAIAYSVKFTGLWFGIMLWPRRRDETDRSVSSSPKTGSDGTGSNRKPTEDSKDKQQETVVPFPGKANAPAAPSKVSSEAPRVPAPAPSVSPKPQLYGSSVSAALRMQPEWPNQQAIADALGVSKGKVSKDLKKLKGQRKAETKRNGKSNVVVARRNGGLHHAVI